MVADMHAWWPKKKEEKKSTLTVNMQNLVRGGWLFGFYDPKLTRLAHLRHFASLRGNSPL